MDNQEILNAVDVLEAAIEFVESVHRQTDALSIELRDRRSDLLAKLNPPRIIDYRQENWQFR